MENFYLSQTRFDSFALQSELLDSLKDAGFEYCSRIQAEALPLALCGQDLAGQAQTGTGKTGAFLIAVFQHLLKNQSTTTEAGVVRCLILAPTRELAIQIADDARSLGNYLGLRIVMIYGGSSYENKKNKI